MVQQGVWDIMKNNKVSFAMLYTRTGSIIWHEGRKIKETDVLSGNTFNRDLIHRVMEEPSIAESYKSKANLLPAQVDTAGETAMDNKCKCIVILRPSNHNYLYLESRQKKSFTRDECLLFIKLIRLLPQYMTSNEREGIKGISGSSREIKAVQSRVIRYAVEDEPILLLGETGVGKNRIARLIHHFSGRKGEFVQVSTPSIPETLLESEVFGHKKGAFTGALNDRQGLAEFAENGTLFFDEISEIPHSFQAKLLQFLDSRHYRKLGDPREKQARVRIIAATNRDLEKEVKNNSFRKDLFYRLSVLPIEIPPLRERKEDIKEIVSEETLLLRGKSPGKGFWDTIFSYHWPGNTRELIHVLKRAGIE